MNWELVKWFGGVIGTLIGIKFIWTLFRTLFSKQSMVKVIDSIGNGAQNAANRMTDKLSQKVQKAKERREEEKLNNKPEVINR